MNPSAPHGLPENLPVVITVLGDIQTMVMGSIVELSGPIMFVKAEHALPTGLPVKVEAEDILWLAEVLRCRQTEGAYSVALDVSQALHGLADLARLAERLLDKPGRVRPQPAAPQLRYV